MYDVYVCVYTHTVCIMFIIVQTTDNLCNNDSSESNLLKMKRGKKGQFASLLHQLVVKCWCTLTSRGHHRRGNPNVHSNWRGTPLILHRKSMSHCRTEKITLMMSSSSPRMFWQTACVTNWGYMDVLTRQGESNYEVGAAAGSTWIFFFPNWFNNILNIETQEYPGKPKIL